MKRIINSPLKVFGFITILLGLAAAILTLGYLLVLGLIFIGVGLVLYLIDFLLKTLFKDNRKFWKAQVIVSIAYLLFASWTYLEWQEHNEIIFPKNFKGQAGIIFGIKGYPPLPPTKFWKKRIEIPSDGIIITSTKAEEIPNSIQFYFKDNHSVNYNNIFWDANFEYDCIATEYKIKAWLFTIGKIETSQVKNKITELSNLINDHKAQSFYKSEQTPIWQDNTGNYLWLQDRAITSLPNAVSNLKIYKAVLTDNDFTKIPKQILDIDSLKVLYIGNNQLTEVQEAITNLKGLEVLGINGNKIKTLPDTLKSLKHLETIYLGNNPIDTTEINRFKKLMPNVEIRQ